MQSRLDTQEDQELRGPGAHREFPRGVLWLALFCLTYLAVEVLAFASYFIITAEPLSLSALRQQRRTIIRKTSSEITVGGDPKYQRQTFKNIILHPYLGYMQEPPKDFINNFGFPLRRQRSTPSGQSVVIAITGGSVAESFFDHVVADEEWTRLLRKVPGLEGVEIDYLLLGLRGYKQPQQLLSVAYYLSMGGRLDILVNIDGYNEVGLAEDMYRVGVFPGYPYHWRPLTHVNVSPSQMRIAGIAVVLVDLRQQLAVTAEALRYSISANVVWYLLDGYIGDRLSRYRSQLHNKIGHPFPYFRDGPIEAVQGQQDIYPWLADVWARSSIQIQSLTKAHGFTYLHFLQPNQYVAGSKPLSAEEKVVAFDSTSRHFRHVTNGYPELLKRDEQLQAQNVPFYDLTRIYQDIDETIYSDRCCHINQEGNRLMSQAIAREIKALLEAR